MFYKKRIMQHKCNYVAFLHPSNLVNTLAHTKTSKYSKNYVVVLYLFYYFLILFRSLF